MVFIDANSSAFSHVPIRYSSTDMISRLNKIKHECFQLFVVLKVILINRVLRVRVIHYYDDLFQILIVLVFYLSFVDINEHF